MVLEHICRNLGPRLLDLPIPLQDFHGALKVGEQKEGLPGGTKGDPGIIECCHCGVWAWDTQVSSFSNPTLSSALEHLHIFFSASDTTHNPCTLSTLFPLFILLTQSYFPGFNLNFTSSDRYSPSSNLYPSIMFMFKHSCELCILYDKLYQN